MKIAIVCGHFIPSMGYIEVHLANAFHQLDYHLEVFTTRIIPSYVRSIGKLSDNTPYKINRLETDFSAGQMVKSKKLVKAIENFSPELVICIGVGKLFPKPIYKMKNRTFKLVTLLGDNEETYTNKKTIKKLKDAVIQQVFKKKVYLQAIKKSDVLFPYTPSTISVINQFVNNEYAELLQQKSQLISLGFDEKDFYYDELERIEQRKKLGLSDHQQLLITATRVVPEKKLEKVVDLIDKINQKGIQINYLILGFQEDSYGNELRDYIAQKESKNCFILKPFANASQIRKYYNAADAAIFSRAAISIFEALATGLFLLLPNQKNVSHILSNANGVYFDELSETDIIRAVDQKEERLERFNEAKKFSYLNLAGKIITLSEV